MKIFVYAIRSLKKNFRYAGITNDVKNRLLRHNSGKNVSTKNFLPFKLIYVEEYEGYNEARKREKFLKSGFGRKFLDNLEKNK